MISRSKNSLEWVFPLNPVAASRPRLAMGRGGKPHAYYTGAYKKFKNEAIDVIEDVFRGDCPLFEGPLAITVEMYVTRPQKTKFDYPKWDIDNGIKACLDCLNKKLWVDDSQIISVYGTKQWAEPGEKGYFIIGVNRPQE